MPSNPLTRRLFLGAGAANAALAQFEKTAANFQPPPGKMPTRVLGKTGVPVSILALGGGVGALTDFPSDELSGKFVQDAIDAGISYLDTAPYYSGKDDVRTSERRYGKAIGNRRGKVYLATKTMQRKADDAMRDIEISLKLLRTDHLDCVQIHYANKKDDIRSWGKPDGVYALLRKLKDQKVIRFIGITSHDCPECLRQAIETYEFDTVLAAYNPTRQARAFEEDLLPVLVQRNLGRVAMKIMGGIRKYGETSVVGQPGRLVGQEPGHAPAGTLLRYALSLPIHTATNGMGDYAQLRENLAVCYSFQPLDQREQENLRSALSGSADWLAYNKPGYTHA